MLKNMVLRAAGSAAVMGVVVTVVGAGHKFV